MVWQSTERLNARNYPHADERKAFRAGYSDGFYNYPKHAGCEKGWYENAYSAGYWEGVGDREKDPK